MNLIKGNITVYLPFMSQVTVSINKLSQNSTSFFGTGGESSSSHIFSTKLSELKKRAMRRSNRIYFFRKYGTDNYISKSSLDRVWSFGWTLYFMGPYYFCKHTGCQYIVDNSRNMKSESANGKFFIWPKCLVSILISGSNWLFFQLTKLR